MRSAALFVRFFWELGMLAAFAYWGFHIGGNTAVNVLVGLAAPVLTAVIWGTFLSPKRRIDLSVSARTALEMLVFGAAALALWAAGQPTLAVVFGVVAIAQRVALSTMGER